MTSKIKIVGIGGSMEEGSSSFLYLKYVMGLLKSAGAETSLIDIKKVKLPIYFYAKGKKPAGPALKKMLDEIHSADGYIFTSPEYHGTVSSSFKNVIDHLEYLSGYNPPYLTQKPVGCIAVGGAENAGTATLFSMISIVHSLRGVVASNSIAIGSAYKQIDKKGSITNESVGRKLKRLADEVHSLSQKLRE